MTQILFCTQVDSALHLFYLETWFSDFLAENGALWAGGRLGLLEGTEPYLNLNVLQVLSLNLESFQESHIFYGFSPCTQIMSHCVPHTHLHKKPFGVSQTCLLTVNLYTSFSYFSSDVPIN